MDGSDTVNLIRVIAFKAMMMMMIGFQIGLGMLDLMKLGNPSPTDRLQLLCKNPACIIYSPLIIHNHLIELERILQPRVVIC